MPADRDVARALLTEYLMLPDAWAIRGQAVPGDQHDLPVDVQQAVAEFPGTAAPPDGDVLLAFDDRNHACGMAVIVPATDVCCELRRVYVRPEARGRRVSEALVAAALDVARAARYESVRLDVLPSRMTAIRLYVRFGFRPIAPFRAYPFDMVFLGLKVRASSSSPTIAHVPLVNGSL